MQNIKYKDLDLLGIELLRKNNESFYKSKLSDVMERIFIAANKDEEINDIAEEYYMKSGTIPDRIYYIYSDRLNEIAPGKIYDIINFKDNPCIWFYSKNAIDKIGEDPVNTISTIYNVLLLVFKSIKLCAKSDTSFFIIEIIHLFNSSLSLPFKCPIIPKSK